MKKKFTVNVTQRDIDKGIAADCKRCPIARALNRLKIFREKGREAHPYGFKASIFEYISKIEKNYIGTIDLPRSAERFTLNFDADKKVKPFKFQIEVEIGD